MTIQPDPNTPNGMWSWAVQRELDGLRSETEHRFVDLANRIDKLVSSAEYVADNRTNATQLGNLYGKISDVEKDLDSLRKEVNASLENVRKEYSLDRVRIETAINQEADTRLAERKEDIALKRSQFRWLVSAILIPIVFGLLQFYMSQK